MKFFIPKQKNSSVFFFDRLFSLATLFHENWQYCKMEKKKFDFPETQGKYPLWYIKLFVYYHWSQITHKKENYGPFVSSGVEKGLENSKVEKFLRFFLFRSTISPEPFVRFWWSFLQTADNLIFFLDKKRKSFKKTSKVRKKSKKLRIDEFPFFGRKLQFQIFCEILKFFKTFLF